MGAFFSGFSLTEVTALVFSSASNSASAFYAPRCSLVLSMNFLGRAVMSLFGVCVFVRERYVLLGFIYMST